jgi:hypothetical protein
MLGKGTKMPEKIENVTVPAFEEFIYLSAQLQCLKILIHANSVTQITLISKGAGFLCLA